MMMTCRQSLLATLCLLGFQSSALGQDVEKATGFSRSSFSVIGGAWTSGDGGWPLGELRIDRRLSQDFVGQAAIIGISRPVAPCSGSVQTTRCGNRELIQMTIVGLRFEPQRGRLRPTSDVSVGWMTYGGDGGAVLSVGVGARFDVNSRLGLLGEGAFHVLAHGDGPYGAALLRCGIFFRL